MLKQLDINPAAVSSTPSTGSKTKCDPAVVTGQIRILFAAYRKADYADPDGFVVQLGVVLSEYPEEVVRYVTSPLTGVQRRLKFPPTIAEVVEACEAAYAPERRRLEREAVARAASRSLPPPRRGRTLDEQARIDAQVADAYAKIGKPEVKEHAAPVAVGDGKHAQRVHADLEARRARRQQDSEAVGS